MSDWQRIDGAALDRYITGNYGEDQFRESRYEMNLENGRDVAAILYKAWKEKHKETFAEYHKKMEYQPPEVSGIPPDWEVLDGKIKECWIALGEKAIEIFN